MIIATGGSTTIDANGNVIASSQSVSNMKRIRQESGWTEGDGDREDLEEMDKGDGDHVVRTFGRWGRDARKDKQVAENTKTAYVAIGDLALSLAEIHEAHRQTQTELAEVLVRNAQADAKAAKRLAESQRRIDAANKEVDRIRKRLKK